jgi:hypothetical protein
VILGVVHCAACVLHKRQPDMRGRNRLEIRDAAAAAAWVDLLLLRYRSSSS